MENNEDKMSTSDTTDEKMSVSEGSTKSDESRMDIDAPSTSSSKRPRSSGSEGDFRSKTNQESLSPRKKVKYTPTTKVIKHFAIPSTSKDRPYARSRPPYVTDKSRILGIRKSLEESEPEPKTESDESDEPMDTSAN